MMFRLISAMVSFLFPVPRVAWIRVVCLRATYAASMLCEARRQRARGRDLFPGVSEAELRALIEDLLFFARMVEKGAAVLEDGQRLASRVAGVAVCFEWVPAPSWYARWWDGDLTSFGEELECEAASLSDAVLALARATK